MHGRGTVVQYPYACRQGISGRSNWNHQTERVDRHLPPPRSMGGLRLPTGQTQKLVLNATADGYRHVGAKQLRLSAILDDWQ